VGERAVWFTAEGPTRTPVYRRTALQAGHSFQGPALVLQYDATVVVAPNWSVRVDAWGNLWLEREGV
jgi:N-methylhydantoinase A